MMLRSVNQNPFFLAPNGVTIILKEGYGVGTVGKADGDYSGKTYTAKYIYPNNVKHLKKVYCNFFTSNFLS